jgi:hypothetical protein
MEAFAQQPHNLRGNDGALACLEPGKLTLLLQQNGCWQQVLSRSLALQQPGALAPLLTQMFAQLEQLPAQVLLACHGVDSRLDSVAGVPVQMLAPAPNWPAPVLQMAGS